MRDALFATMAAAASGIGLCSLVLVLLSPTARTHAIKRIDTHTHCLGEFSWFAEKRFRKFSTAVATAVANAYGWQ